MRTAFFRKEMTEGRECLVFYWVVTPHGAVSTWFSNTKAILGHSVCSGETWHWPRPFPGAEPHGPCEFLEADCWTDCGSLLGLEPIVEAFDRGDDDAIYRWLEASSDRLIGEV